MISYIDKVLDIISVLDAVIWTYAGVPALIGLGFYFTWRSHFFQIKRFPAIFKNFVKLAQENKPDKRGVAPLQVFFASIGGGIGTGNIVAVCTAVKVGGPGAVFWMWVAACVGMLVKYAEIYLGVRYRVRNNNNSYDGGPMIYLQRAFGNRWVANLFCLLLFIYGVEIYIFRLIATEISYTWSIDYSIVVLFLLAATLCAGRGGVRLIGKVSSVTIPIFLLIFVLMSCWVIVNNIMVLPEVLTMIVTSAFTGSAAVGAFTGSTMMMALSQGVGRACYTGDLGIGYDAIIHSETEEASPARQASLGIIGIFIDTFIICTMSLLLILLTGVWHQGIDENRIVAVALGKYFPYVDMMWPLFIFLLGYSTIIAFFVAGRKAALFLWPRYGNRIFMMYALCAFVFFSYCGEVKHAQGMMAIVGAGLLVVNVLGMIVLRKDIKFHLH
jgi:alanine or glycine:cation symporter, AGCS family